jgi:cell wall assembly regulator SMI1
MGVKLPKDYRQFLSRHDGSGEHFVFPYKIGGGGQSFLSLEHCLLTWGAMVKVGEDFARTGETGEQEGPIKPGHWNRLWIPYTENGCGDHLFIDLDPAEGGTVGQIVDWWHECARSTYQSPSLCEWLNEVVTEIRNGVYHFGDEM